jgi:hypothetical protein
MSWLLTALICIAVIEIVLRMPLARLADEARDVLHRSQHTLRSDAISDHWKEKVLLVYARKLFACTLQLAFIILAIGSLVVCLIWLADQLVAESAEFVLSWRGLLYSTLFATAYVKLRRSLA